jgi:protein SCO1/2
MDLVFTNETGAAVTLGELTGGRPAILVLAYYGCPMLCTYVINDVASVVKQLPFELGKEYDVVTVSFDAREQADLAAKKKENMVHQYDIVNGGRNWHFLVGGEEAIRRLTDTVGFSFKYDEDQQEFAHASGIMIMTGQGKLSHYFYGVGYSSKDVRLALVEASENRIGSAVDKLLLYCYHYDLATGKYSAAITRILKVAGIATFLALATFLIVMFRRELKARPVPAVGGAH